MPAPETQHGRKPLYVWLLLTAISLTWGSSFILMKRGMDAFTAEQVACWRIFIGALALTPFWFRVRRPQWLGKKLGYILLVVTVGSVIPAFLFTIAETHISSSLAGVLNSLTPLFTILVGYLLFKTKVRPLQIVGVVLGFVGAASVIFFQADGRAENDYSYSFLVLLATLFYAISANTIKGRLTGIPSYVIVTVGFGIMGPLAGLYLAYTGAFGQLTHQPAAQHAFWYMLILGALGTGYANFAYYYLIQKTSPLFASIATYLMPIVAVLWGILDHESFGLIHIAGMGLILLGIWLTGR